MNTPAISAFSIGHYEEVIALWQHCEGIGLSSADSYESIERYLDRNPGMSFIARIGAQMVGAVLSGHDGRRGYIHHLAVLPEYRRRGVGKALVEKCLEALRAARIEKCHLFIFSDNVEGIRFWERAHWTMRTDLKIASKTTEPAPARDADKAPHP